MSAERHIGLGNYTWFEGFEQGGPKDTEHLAQVLSDWNCDRYENELTDTGAIISTRREA